MMRLLIIFLLSITLNAWGQDQWLTEVENRIDDQAVEWLRALLKEEEGNRVLEPSLAEPCKNCLVGQPIDIAQSTVYVFMSFSIPDSVWLDLSQGMEGESAVFVVRGLPHNSFQSFASQLARLREKGMDIPVQIHPHLFKEYEIAQVPAYIFLQGESYAKLMGNVSLRWAKEKSVGSGGSPSQHNSF